MNSFRFYLFIFKLEFKVVNENSLEVNTLSDSVANFDTQLCIRSKANSIIILIHVEQRNAFKKQEVLNTTTR